MSEELKEVIIDGRNYMVRAEVVEELCNCWSNLDRAEAHIRLLEDRLRAISLVADLEHVVEEIASVTLNWSVKQGKGRDF